MRGEGLAKKMESASGRAWLRMCIFERLIRMVVRMRHSEVLGCMVRNVEEEWEVGRN